MLSASPRTASRRRGPAPRPATVSLTFSNGLCRFAEVVAQSAATVDVLVADRCGIARGTRVDLTLSAGARNAVVRSVTPWGDAYRVELELQSLAL